jgi:hypothetical protein
MRKSQLIPSVLLFVALSCPAQGKSISSKRDWRAVQGLNPGTAISVKTYSLNRLCYFERATAEELVCEPLAPGFLRTPPGPYPFPYPYPSGRPAEYVFRRTVIQEVRLEHSEATNELIGIGIGGGIGAALGAARFDQARAGGALILGIVGAAIGRALGRTHPLFHCQVIYRR